MNVTSAPPPPENPYEHTTGPTEGYYSSPRTEFRRARARSQTVVFGSAIIGVIALFLLGFLGVNGALPIPFGGDFSKRSCSRSRATPHAQLLGPVLGAPSESRCDSSTRPQLRDWLDQSERVLRNLATPLPVLTTLPNTTAWHGSRPGRVVLMRHTRSPDTSRGM